MKLIIPEKSKVPPLKDWDKLFAEAKAAGFDVDKDAEEFVEWDVLLADEAED